MSQSPLLSKAIQNELICYGNALREIEVGFLYSYLYDFYEDLHHFEVIGTSIKYTPINEQANTIQPAISLNILLNVQGDDIGLGISSKVIEVRNEVVYHPKGYGIQTSRAAYIIIPRSVTEVENNNAEETLDMTFSKVGGEIKLVYESSPKVVVINDTHYNPTHPELSDEKLQHSIIKLYNKVLENIKKTIYQRD